MKTWLRMKVAADSQQITRPALTPGEVLVIAVSAERNSRAPLVRSQEQPQVLLLQDSSMVLFFALCTWRQ